MKRSLSQAVFAGLIMLVSLWQFPAAALDPAKPPSGNFDLSDWKLQLPINARGELSGANDATEVSVSQLNTGFTNAYFYTGADGAMVFWAPVPGARTSTSSYPRSELREMLSPSISGSNWFAYGTHTLDAQCQVLQVPSSGKVIIGQIHGYTGAALPLVKIYYDNGKNTAMIKTNANDDASDIKYSNYGTLGLSNNIVYQIKVVNGLVSVAINGVTNSLNVFVTDPDWATNTMYYKAGDYCQDNVGTTNEGARVAFYSVKLSHAPAISGQPTNQGVTPGQNATFTVGANGNGPLGYQWRFNATNALARATNAFLTITNAQSTNAGSYSVAVTDSLGSVTSAVAVLTVNASVGPSITTQPSNQTVLAGQNATFTVVAGGNEPLSYQWWFNTTNSPPWATNASLTITNAQSTDAGSYAVVVANPYGPAVTSAVAILTVNPISSNLQARGRYQAVITNQAPRYYNPLDNALTPAVGTGTFVASPTGAGFGNDYFGNVNGAASFSDSLAQLSVASGGNVVNGVGAANSIGSLSLLFCTPDTTLTNTAYIFSNGDVATSGTGYQFSLNLNNAGQLVLKAGNKTITNGLAALTGGTWYYYAVTWDFSGANSPNYGIHYYWGVAGQPSSSLSSGFMQRGGSGNISSTAILGTNGPFVLSGKQPPANSGSGFQTGGNPGRVDELAAWNSELSASQIADQFSALIVSGGPPPTLDMSVSGPNVTISWPSRTDPGFVLQSTTNLTSPSWVGAGTPVLIGDRNVVTNAIVGEAQFYRLKK